MSCAANGAAYLATARAFAYARGWRMVDLPLGLRKATELMDYTGLEPPFLATHDGAAQTAAELGRLVDHVAA